MTLNQLVAKIKSIGDGHKMIATTFNGSAIDALDTELTYPVMTFTTDVARVNGQTITFDVSMFFFDRLMQGNDNEREVQSDQLEIAKDIISQLRNQNEEFLLLDAVTLNFFTDSTPELLAGVNAVIQLELPFQSDRCQVPTDYSIN